VHHLLETQILSCPDLPTLPEASTAALSHARNANTDIASLVAIVERDPALRARLLRVLNSGVFGLSRRVLSIEQAAAAMGPQALCTLVLGLSLVKAFQDQRLGGFNHQLYWRRSMYAATAARVIAVHVLESEKDNCFAAGMLMDIGMLVFDRVLGSRYGEVCNLVRAHVDLPVIEVHMFGADHAEVGQFMAERWDLPLTLAVPIGAHHGPQAVEDPALRDIAQVIWLAGRCADVFVAPQVAAETIMEVRRSFMTHYRLTEVQCDAILCAIGRKTAELAHLFDVRLNTPVNFEQVADRASMRLTELSLAERRKGVANRRRTARKVRNGRISIIPCRHGILGRPIQVLMHDASSTGMGFTHDQPMAVGQQFVIQLPDPITGAAKTLLYSVVRCDMRCGVASIGAELVNVLRPEAVLRQAARRQVA